MSKKLNRYLFLYIRMMSQQLKAILEYQADFLITCAAAALQQVLSVIFIWVIYQSIPDINGWGFWQIVFIHALLYFTEGFCPFCFDGIWNIRKLVNTGEMDRLLTRPMPILLQVLSNAIGMNGLGNIVMGGILLVQSLRHIEMQWSIGGVIFFLVILICGVAIRASIYLVGNTIPAFWSQSQGSAFPYMLHSLGDFAKYPLTIYPIVIQLLISIVIPYGFISYYPATFLFGKHMGQLGIITPLAALACMMVASSIFRIGLGKYESTGH